MCTFLSFCSSINIEIKKYCSDMYSNLSRYKTKNTHSGREMSNTRCCIEVAASPEQLCYIPCSFCNIVLAVSVPCNNLFDMVTVRCGHCTNLLSVNVGMAAGFNQSHPNSTSQDDSSSSHHHHQQQDPNHTPPSSTHDIGTSTICMPTNDQKTINRPPEKRQRVPSAYNQFIKQEIQRIKANDPNISHREAFSAAAKNWAHFPHIHFGLMLEGNNHQSKPNEQSYEQGSKKRLKATTESFNK